ncbi:MAG TPA: sugar-binding domain-containing protein, partial [Bacillota bacterium]|nr:sugar-binding domain-containing protein [Bacillota bacterium]
DICARYFNFQGEFIDNCFQKRIVGISVEEMKNAKTVIGIAADPEKGYVVAGALGTDIIDILITDEQTAKAILKI